MSLVLLVAFLMRANMHARHALRGRSHWVARRVVHRVVQATTLTKATKLVHSAWPVTLVQATPVKVTWRPANVQWARSQSLVKQSAHCVQLDRILRERGWPSASSALLVAFLMKAKALACLAVLAVSRLAARPAACHALLATFRMRATEHAQHAAQDTAVHREACLL